MEKKYIKELKEKFASIPEQQILAGLYVRTFGYKYVTILDVWEGTKVIKCCYDCFKNQNYRNCGHTFK